MIKRINSKIWLLVILFIFMLNIELVKNQVSAEVYEGTCGKNVTWILDTETGVLTIEGNGDMQDYTYNNSPWYNNRNNITQVIIKEGVTSICDYAFYNCVSLTSIELPNSVTRIGKGAFSDCTNLSSIIIPNGVTSIGHFAFSDCDNLKEVIFEENSTLNEIGQSAFHSCVSLTSIIIPTDVISIGYYTFSHCISLKAVIFEENSQLTSIEHFAFEYCESLVSIDISEKVETIDYNVFGGCSRLKSINVDENNEYYKSIDGVLYSKDGKTLIQYPIGKEDSIFIIPEGVINIEKDSFNGTPGLYGIFNSKIHGHYIKRLTTIVLPSSLEKIEDYAFGSYNYIFKIINNSNLELEFNSTEHGNITYNAKLIIDKNGNKTYRDGVTEYIEQNDFVYIKEYDEYKMLSYIGNKETATLPLTINNNKYTICELKGVKNVVIPEGFTSINDYAFWNSRYLESISIPQSVLYIGNYAFGGCCSLKNVEIPNNVTSLGRYSFYQCVSLESVKISNRITNINTGSFYACDSLKYIEIPSSVTRIGSEAFGSCNSLEYIKIPNSVTSIGNYAFYYCNNLTSIEIPTSVANMGYDVFKNCTNLTICCGADSLPRGWSSDWNISNCPVLWGYCFHELQYTLNDDKKSYSVSGKEECDDISIVIPSEHNGLPVTNIDKWGFDSCTTLESIVIPNSVTNIGEGAFRYCYRLKSIEIPNSVTSIGSSAFLGCTNLTSIEIPTSITSIGISAFNGCSRLTSINVDSNNEYYKSIDGVLYSKDGKTLIRYPEGKEDTSFIIPDDVTIMGKYAFVNCDNLSSIEIPTSITSIGEFAFVSCRNLKTIEISNSVTSIGKGAFVLCESLTNIKIPSSVTSIGEAVFEFCTGLTSIDVDQNNEYYKSINGVLYSKDGTTLIRYPSRKIETAFIIPNSVTNIDVGAFFQCESLISIKIPSSVINIEGYAFSYCTSLMSIEIPSSVTSIGENTFNGCENLTIYCASQSKPSGWDENWNPSNCPVVWGYKDSTYTSGDLDGDELVNTSDVIYLLMHTYFEDTYPVTQDCDYDNDGIVNTSDVIYLLMHTYFPETYPIG